MSQSTSNKRQYVTCFPGARDAYQLPYTLYKYNRLDCFITDLYNKSWLNKIPLGGFRQKLTKRSFDNDALPHQLIDVHPEVILRRKVIDRFYHNAQASVIEDDMYAGLAVDAAERNKSGLFLYEFQAETAFKHRFTYGPVKHVFYFHPHPSFEHPMLLADAEKYPGFKAEVLDNTRQSFGARYRDHTKTAWKNADHIFVASSFTKRSLCEIGAKESDITVAPYGVTIPESFREVDLSGEPFFLFVGSAAHRKGLHHLLEAWKMSGLAGKGKLIVVSRTADKFNEQLLTTTPGVVWKKGVERSELIDLFSRASLFVLPSMSEGFGHVYLEALNFGCPVLGTDHSILADIDDHPEVIRKVEPGNVEQLTAALIDLWSKQPGLNMALRRQASQISKRFTWERFQETIETALTNFD